MITAMTTELLASIANTAGVVVVVAALATLVVGLLERTHRRESGLGHAPFGADLGASDRRDRVRDRDTLRALDELRAAGVPDAASPARRIPARPRPRPDRAALSPSATPSARSEHLHSRPAPPRRRPPDRTGGRRSCVP